MHTWAYAEFCGGAVGCKAILLTADSPVLGIRWNETRNHLALPAGLGFPIMGQAALTAGKSSKDGFSSLNGRKFLYIYHATEERLTRSLDDGHSWERDVPWLRSITKMQIWIKGGMSEPIRDHSHPSTCAETGLYSPYRGGHPPCRQVRRGWRHRLESRRATARWCPGYPGCAA
jgi:hypothetical protein